LLVDVEGADVADSYEPFVSVPLVALAGNVLSPDKPLKGLLRQCAAHLLLTLAGTAGLLHLRGVDTVEPDLVSVDVDGVAVHDAVFACDVGMGMGWDEAKNEEKPCDNKGPHN